MKPPPLPVPYSHDHFTEMLSFVADVYAPVLDAPHRAFIATFAALSRDAQCLLIRMINRRGRIFRHAALRYAEISDPSTARDELRDRGLVRPLAEPDYAAFLRCHARDALIQAGRDAGCADLRTSWSKAKLVDYFLAHVSFTTAHAR